VDVTLLGGPAVPVDSGGRIGGTALPALQHEAHHELRGWIPVLGERQPFEVGRVVVAATVGQAAVGEVGPGEAGAQQDRERGQGEECERSV
jgi:hypothetical protein